MTTVVDNLKSEVEFLHEKIQSLMTGLDQEGKAHWLARDRIKELENKVARLENERESARQTADILQGWFNDKETQLTAMTANAEALASKCAVARNLLKEQLKGIQSQSNLRGVIQSIDDVINTHLKLKDDKQ